MSHSESAGGSAQQAAINQAAQQAQVGNKKNQTSTLLFHQNFDLKRVLDVKLFEI